MRPGAVTAVIVLAVAIARPAPAAACSCPRPRAVCEALFDRTVFVGKVTDIVTTPNRARAQTTFEVVDTLHSTFPLPETVTIEHGTDGNTRGISFVKNRSYVVYAGGNSPSELSVNACGNTHALRKNDPDVAFAKQKSSLTTAVIIGKVVLVGEEGETLPPGTEVRTAGRSAKTNARGEYRIEVPLGNHVLEIGNPELRLSDDFNEPVVAVPSARACARRTLRVEYDGRIEGTVTGASGGPVVGVEVGAARLGNFKRLTARTDSSGRYRIHKVPPGTFKVGVSVPDYGGPSPESPYPTTFYGKTITTKRAGLVSNIDFSVPPPIKRVTFTGTVRRADGTPVPKAYVTITPAGKNRSTSGPADDGGVYKAVELAGEDVTIKSCDGGKCVEVKRTKIAADETIDLTVR